MLVSFGMFNLDFEDDGGKKFFLFKFIKLYLDLEKLNILVDSNGNIIIKFWWLDFKIGRWVVVFDVWMVKKIFSKVKRFFIYFLFEIEIVLFILR